MILYGLRGGPKTVHNYFGTFKQIGQPSPTTTATRQSSEHCQYLHNFINMESFKMRTILIEIVLLTFNLSYFKMDSNDVKWREGQRIHNSYFCCFFCGIFFFFFSTSSLLSTLLLASLINSGLQTRLERKIHQSKSAKFSASMLMYNTLCTTINIFYCLCVRVSV